MENKIEVLLLNQLLSKIKGATSAEDKLQHITDFIEAETSIMANLLQVKPKQEDNDENFCEEDTEEDA